MDHLLAAVLPICRDIAPSVGSTGTSTENGRGPLRAEPAQLDAAYQRSADFSRKVQTADLSARERQILSLVDGRRTIANIVDQTKMKSSEALAILRRMEELDLVRAAPSAGVLPGQIRTASKVLIFEPDGRTFRRQLERLLGERTDPLEMVPVSRPEELAAAVAREPPRLVLLNATAAGDKALGIAPAVREASAGASTKIAAMLEMPSAQGRQFSVAGFDAVLVKPIPYTDIDALLTTAGFF
jgi:hypothetical protein